MKGIKEKMLKEPAAQLNINNRKARLLFNNEQFCSLKVRKLDFYFYIISDWNYVLTVGMRQITMLDLENSFWTLLISFFRFDVLYECFSFILPHHSN